MWNGIIKIIFCRVYVTVPSQPRDLRATEIGESSITLEWTKPAHSGENILGYDLIWNDTYSKVGFGGIKAAEMPVSRWY